MTRTVRDLGSADVDALQRLLESHPAYAECLTGYPPGPADALSALISVPPDFDPALLTQLASQKEISKVRLGIVQTVEADAAPFWKAMGYVPTGEQSRYRYSDVESEVTMWERLVAR